MKIPNIKKIIKGKLDTKNEHKYVNHKIHCPNKKIFFAYINSYNDGNGDLFINIHYNINNIYTQNLKL